MIDIKAISILYLLVVLSVSGFSQSVLLDGFGTFNAGEWSIYGYPALTQELSDGAAGSTACLNIFDNGYIMSATKSYPGVVPEDGDYRVTFFYKNGHADAPQAGLQMKINGVVTVNLPDTVVSDWTPAQSDFLYGLKVGDSITIDIIGYNSGALAQQCRFDEFILVKDLVLAGSISTTSVSPDPVPAGNSMTINFVVTNTGNAPQSFGVSGEIWQGSELKETLGSKTTSTISPDGTDSGAFIFSVPATWGGTYTANTSLWTGAPGSSTFLDSHDRHFGVNAYELYGTVTPSGGSILSRISTIIVNPVGGTGNYISVSFDVSGDGSIEYTDSSPGDGFSFDWDTTLLTSSGEISDVTLGIAITDSDATTAQINPVYGIDNRYYSGQREFYVSPGESITSLINHIQYLESIHEATPPSELDRNTIHLNVGEYEDPYGAGLPDSFLMTTIPSYWNVIGVLVLDATGHLDEAQSSVLKSGLHLLGEYNSLVNFAIKIDAQQGIAIHVDGDNSIVKNVYFTSDIDIQTFSTRGIFAKDYQSNNLVDGCVFDQLRIGISYEVYSGLRIRNSIFQRSKYGVISALGGYLDLGGGNDENTPGGIEDPGNNVFFRLEYFGRILSGTATIPAEMNYWYGDTDVLLDSTEEILSKWIFLNSKVSLGSNDNNSLLAHDINQIPENAVDVYPFQTHDFFTRTTGLNDWRDYR